MKREQLISILGNCINACNHCADACLDEPNVQHMATCIRTDHVCAEVCSSLSQILHTKYKNVEGLVRYCISVCKDCKATCEGHDHDHCKACAKACDECIRACEAFLAA
ncbi:four-helix bundle copper-binding protein [Jejudonia soesokkakensis]|uniref:Four-helix bundle copper-binding protein n=2 Tax=Jejudonia soesokkakensis TaxID=1323432 RepID=A0ABW2MVC4_9FLAO